MTIPMDNDKEKSSKDRVQRLFNKNIELENKRRKAAQARVPSDPNAWQQIRENYEAILLEDHAFSEQHDIEYALWQLHYRRIEELRAHFNAALASAGSAAPQNGKVPVRAGPDRLTKIRSQFKIFLSEATGFYHDLLLKIRAKYGLPLGYFSDAPEDQIPLSKDADKAAELKKGLISCHRCLIYLGDLARYKGLYGEGDSKARDFAAASSYYMQASSLWPSSGNPHHQLAILAGYANDELVSIYRYFRSLSVDNAFITARDNLIIAFEKNRQSYTQLLGNAKPSPARSSRMHGKGRGRGDGRTSFNNNRLEATPVKEKAYSIPELFKFFITRFVRLHGILFTCTSLETFDEVFSMVKSHLLELLSSGPHEEFNFGSDAAECKLVFVRLIAILIFTVHNVNRENENHSYADILQRSVLRQNAFTATFEFMGYILERCNQLSDPASSYLLPGIMVFVEWLACCQDVAVGSEVEEKQANARSFFWKNCIAFFNTLLSSGYMVNEDKDETCFSNMSKYDESETANRLALPEDFELRGYLPLLPAHLILDFSRKYSFGSEGGTNEKKGRIQRIIAAGKALANVVKLGQEAIYFDMKLKNFLIGVEPQISDDRSDTNPLEIPNLNGESQENLAGGQRGLDDVPKPETSMMEDEDEDEVIVFKPPATEKHFDTFGSKMTSAEVRNSVIGSGTVDLGYKNGSFPLGHDNFPLQNALSASMKQPAMAATGDSTSQYLQPVLPNPSKWLVDQAPLVNGLSRLHLMENGPSVKPEVQVPFPSQPAAFSVPYPTFVSTGSNYGIPVQMSQTSAPSAFDLSFSAGVATDGVSSKPSPVVSAGVKKNPVSRPVRHAGPPPGFGSVPSKAVVESFSSTSSKTECPIPQVDNYSWLDGYQLSSNQSVGLMNSHNPVGPPTFHSVSKSNGSMGLTSFPFPGKQSLALQVQSENQKGLQDYRFSEQMKLYQEQQQVQKGNQQSVVLPQQSLWESHFFV